MNTLHTLTMSLLNATCFMGYNLFQQAPSFTRNSLALQFVDSDLEINPVQEISIGIAILFCAITLLHLIKPLALFLRRPPMLTDQKPRITFAYVSDLEFILLEALSTLESVSARMLLRSLNTKLPNLTLTKVNSTLYKMLKDELVVMRKEGVKPIWSLA